MDYKKIRVMICPDRSGPYLELLAKELETNGASVLMIPWFGKQAPYSFLKLMLGLWLKRKRRIE
jgi:hypothetical protein